MSDSPEVKVAATARALVERAWCKRSYARRQEDGSFAYCASGALVKAREIVSADALSALEVAQLFRESVGLSTHPVDHIAEWNDHPNRTQADVVHAFDQVLGRLLNPGSKDAIGVGCRCPRVDNAHGAGYMRGSDGQPIFVYSGLCPLHADGSGGGGYYHP